MFKKSYYNIEFEYNKLHYIYNTISGAFIELNNEEYKLYCENNGSFDKTNFTMQLYDNGLLIEKHKDEKENIIKVFKDSKLRIEQVSLVLAPFLGCNFNCSYCYERGKMNNHIMNNETQNQVVKYADYLIKKCNSIYIAWTGGEPLMAKDVIINISEKIKNMCEKSQKNYSGYIVTNGSLLNFNTARELSKVGINSVQITLDGIKEVHDTNRPFKNGMGSFDVIIKNLKEVYPLFNRLDIRVNIDKINDSHFLELKSILQSFDKESKIKLYLSRIENNATMQNAEELYTVSEFKEYQLNVATKINKDMFDVIYPDFKLRYCMADSYFELIIGPDGEIYKCWSDIGIDERKIGDINKFITYTNKEFTGYNKFNIWDVELCKNCKLLPICLGGCPREVYDNHKPTCQYDIKYLKNLLINYYYAKEDKDV